MSGEKGKQGTESGRSRTAVKLVILLVVVMAGFLMFRYTPLSAYTNPERLQGFFTSIASFWWAPLVYIAVYVVGSLVAAPGFLLTILGGLTFGTLKGTLYVIIGANLGANLTFGMARVLGREFVAKRVKGPIDVIDRQFKNQGFLRVLQLRLVPIIPFNIMNYICGLSGVRYLHYMLATLFGMIPAIFIFVYSASTLSQLYFAGVGSQDETTQAAARTATLTNVGISLALLVIVSLAPYLYRRFNTSSKPAQS